MLRDQGENWIAEQDSKWDYIIGFMALACGIGSIILAGAVIAVLFE